MRTTLTRPWFLACALALLLCLLALARPLDHDESQYVAAAVLSAHGYLPYRDYAYLQTPLQPLLFAPIAWIAGAWTWLALRLLNALLGAITVACVYCSVRAGGRQTRPALIAAGLFASCDILLFSAGTARNDALPAALLAAALPLVLRADCGRATARSAALAGALLAAAAAVKISYALPAGAYGFYALVQREHRPGWIAAGAAPFVLFIALMAAIAPHGFAFGALIFPSSAPAEYYTFAGRAWKLGIASKLLDTLKFLALGPALPALALVAWRRSRDSSHRAIAWMLIVALVSALLPSPTWRQYLLPALPLLFVLLAAGCDRRPPGRAIWTMLAIFAVAGLTPSILALAGTIRNPPMIEAAREGAAIRAAMDGAQVRDGVATLSPQFLPATGRLPDARFATGPFYFRSRHLLDPASEARDHVVSGDSLALHFGLVAPPAILIGGEGPWTSGDAVLDTILERWALANGYVRHDIPGSRFRLYVRPR